MKITNIWLALTAGLLATAAHAGSPRFSPTTYNFGSVPIGSSATVNVDLDSASTFDRLRSLGIDAAINMTWSYTYGDFKITPGNCNPAGPTGTPMAQGLGCTFSLTYTPTHVGPVTAVVTVTDHNQGAWGWMNISATATPAPAPASIPTLSEWGVIGLSSILAMFGIARMRRRQL